MWYPLALALVALAVMLLAYTQTPGKSWFPFGLAAVALLVLLYAALGPAHAFR